MLKRRNWRELHGTGPQEDDSQDSGSGSGKQISTHQSSCPPADADTASCAEAASKSDDLESQPSGDEDLADRRLEDLTDSSEGSGQEDASESGTSSAEDEQAVPGQAPGQKGAAAYWAPRRCKLCPGVLLLNPTSLEQHTASKKHRRLLGQDAEDGFDPIVMAEEVEVSMTRCLAQSH